MRNEIKLIYFFLMHNAVKRPEYYGLWVEAAKKELKRITGDPEY